jgi:quercetin dioxygenase-like cupin family protein
MSVACVVAQSEAVGMREAGDTAIVLETIGTLEGSEVLTQRVIHFDTGRSHPRQDVDHEDLLFVVSGAGRIELPSGDQPLEPGTAVHLRAGEAAVVENPSPDALVVVSVLVPPAARGTRGARSRKNVLRLEDQPEQRADEKRTYRVLFDADTGCHEATQFVGYVEPYRAPDHSHPYDEVGYVLSGNGLAHLGTGDPLPLGPGSCFHLPREHVHCIENVGPGTMEILGVFHPAESPAARSYDAAANEPSVETS